MRFVALKECVKVGNIVADVSAKTTERNVVETGHAVFVKEVPTATKVVCSAFRWKPASGICAVHNRQLLFKIVDDSFARLAKNA